MRPYTLLKCALAVNVAVTVAVMLLAYRALRRADETERLVMRSHQTLEAAEETFRRALDAQSGTRGFILSRDVRYLEPFTRAERRIVEPIDELRTLLAETGRGAEAERLRVGVAGTFASLHTLIDETRRGEEVNAQNRDSADKQMNAVRTTLRGIRNTETDLLKTRIRADESAGRWANRLAIVMTGLATASLTAIVMLALFLARPGIWRAS
jgi:CHASE3 domain sensor protein